MALRNIYFCHFAYSQIWHMTIEKISSHIYFFAGFILRWKIWSMFSVENRYNVSKCIFSKSKPWNLLYREFFDTTDYSKFLLKWCYLEMIDSQKQKNNQLLRNFTKKFAILKYMFDWIFSWNCPNNITFEMDKNANDAKYYCMSIKQNET